MKRPHIVILGAGFGGMYAAKRLARASKHGEVDVTIVNRTNYFLFTPLLHEVATGSLTPLSVAEPIREVVRNTGIRVVQGAIRNIDQHRRSVSVAGGAGAEIDLPYDYLVIATGAESSFYDIPGAEEHGMPLKNLMDAARIRNRVIDSFERAVLLTDQAVRREALSFAVVGGGATGVETAAELAEFVAALVHRYYKRTCCCQPDDDRHCRPEEPTVSLVHAGPELLEQFSPKLRTAARIRLERLGVRLKLDSKVMAVDSRGLDLSDDRRVPATTVIWAAGVTPAIPQFVGAHPALIGSRLAVDAHFRLIGDDKVFVVGDAAGYIDDAARARSSTAGKPLPFLAQVAVREARVVADNVLASIRGTRLRSYAYRSKGSLVSLGKWYAIGDIFSLHLTGRATWFIWRTVYLFKFSSWRKRIRIVFEWTVGLFYSRDVTKLS